MTPGRCASRASFLALSLGSLCALLLTVTHCGGAVAGAPAAAEKGDSAVDPVDAGTEQEASEADLPETTPGRTPKKHRPVATACPTVRGAGLVLDGGVPDGGAGGCASDSDCTFGANGRCLPVPHQGGVVLATTMCSYDECSVDTDCAAGGVCECGGSIGTAGSDGTPMRTGNACVEGNCRIDTDCGPYGFCSPTSVLWCSVATVGGYYCHMPADTCVDDADCTKPGICARAPVLGSWACTTSGGCG